MSRQVRTRHALSRSILSSLVLAACPLAATAQDAPTPPAEELSDFQKALIDGRTWANLRYRVEVVDQDGPFVGNATASTLRTVLGYETAAYEGFKVLLEFEDVAPIGNDKTYNSTTNGVGALRPVVADPDGTEVNQLYLTYGYGDDLRMRLGRQEIVHGNSRFVGNVAWRQNYQSFDAVRLTHTGIPDTTLDYSFLHTVNRIFGEDSPAGEERMRSHLFDARHKLEGIGELAGYAYFLDFDMSNAIDTRTLGARIAGSRAVNDDFDVLYGLEYADQKDAGGKSGSINSEYYLAEVGVGFMGAKLKISEEHLGGSGAPGDAFSTPLATLHKFNGFADVFLMTPNAGLQDRYVSCSRTIAGVNLAAIYHHFDSDRGSTDYGWEFDLVATYKITKRLGVGVKYADFNVDGSAAGAAGGLPGSVVDTERIMTWFTYSLL